ncbi:MAG: hypothetical protein MR809_01640 [Rikenellaceae bacterium]|nr:hypothetical protein [Rikenellaceae bacterium]
MSVSVNIPEITVLCSRVEEKYGKPLETHNCFISLVGAIEAEVREHVSESTLERIWGYSTRGAESVSLRTLNVLSCYVGASSWKGFCAGLKHSSQIESEEFSGDSIVSAALAVGKRLKLGWLPDRIITVEYRGMNRFVVIESINSSLRLDDSFECLQIQLGRPLYLDRFRRANTDGETRYVVGERSGLTLVKVL